MKVENLTVFSDSMLVVGNIRSGFQARGPRTDLYMRYTQELISRFKEVNLEQIPRVENGCADTFTKFCSQGKATLLGVIPLEIQLQPSIPKAEVMNTEVSAENLWTTPIVEYEPTEFFQVTRMKLGG